MQGRSYIAVVEGGPAGAFAAAQLAAIGRRVTGPAPAAPLPTGRPA